MQRLIRDLWQSTATTILFVTQNTQEALRLGTRIIVLAKESAHQASRVMFDLAVPQPCHENDIPRLVRRLESVSERTDAEANVARLALTACVAVGVR